MIEVSLLLFTLLIEALVVCLVILILWLTMSIRRKKKDRAAAKKLVDQIKHQSQTRLETTSSFLNERYRFEGNELKKAVKSIDKAEKKFIQNIINIYLKRDAGGLAAMDASMAEMIDNYKSLSPVMPDEDNLATLDSGKAEELVELKEANEKLSEELAITKETMGNMISEFGNMFGGGKDHELAKHEVVEKVKDHEFTQGQGENDDGDDDIELDTVEQESVSVEQSASPDVEQAPVKQQQEADNVQNSDKKPDEEVIEDDDVDELLNSIDLSGGNKS